MFSYSPCYTMIVLHFGTYLKKIFYKMLLTLIYENKCIRNRRR